MLADKEFGFDLHRFILYERVKTKSHLRMQ
jgi:hypothetical protein